MNDDSWKGEILNLHSGRILNYLTSYSKQQLKPIHSTDKIFNCIFKTGRHLKCRQ
jgi:hypothetical protein